MKVTFDNLGVDKSLRKGLKEVGIVHPTFIQERAIPFLIQVGTDFIGQASTGTGKTAAFGLPLLQRTDLEVDDIQSIILAPTRELVQQIKKQMFKYTKYSEQVYMETVFGGAKIGEQISRLRRTTHIVIATPGRLLDLIDRKAIDLSQVNTVVLDEADEMMSMGFRQAVEKILKHVKKNPKIWLFSATMSADVKKIVREFMAPDAMRVNVDKKDGINTRINHQYVKVSLDNKAKAIKVFLKAHRGKQGMIFCRTKAGARALAADLAKTSLDVAVLEGDMKQKERDKVMRAFKAKKVTYLVATDVAARGIDVNDLAFVVHHQLPDQVDYFVHRSGRTARAGKSGVSIAFILAHEVARINNLEEELGITFKENLQFNFQF